MTRSLRHAAALAAAFVLLAPSARAAGTNVDSTVSPPAPAAARGFEPVRFVERDLSGPRVGFTVAPGSDRAYRSLRDNDMGRVVSQFGWHFEHQVTPVLGGPQLVTEVTPLFGGVEYGKVVPSVTLSIGLRSRGGYEIGMGPSLTLGNADSGGSVALAIAAGRSLDFGGVRIQLNLAVSTNPKGTMVSVLAGYSIPRLMR